MIIPTINEAALIGGFLGHLRKRLPGAELIVVDGGSDDQTVALADQQADRVLRSLRGRAKQMNAGAAVASGEVLWFLHADSLVPSDPSGSIVRALDDPETVGGCFRLKFPRREWVYRVSDSLGNVAVDLFQIALGDHGIFCRRTAFARVEGYPDVPLMEDAEFYRRLRRVGRVRQLPAYIVSSPRRYEQLGPARTTACYLLILILYLTKVPPETLYVIYRKFVGRKES
ncbi:MAG: TIGR04283 family arsenosugar biosynthesis glycosyltransferase [Rhodospirillales bacterium]|nr:TIGR04283 family arsenosugar biosynthesis glycosyltransferase [Acetobacter sp.]